MTAFCSTLAFTFTFTLSAFTYAQKSKKNPQVKVISKIDAPINIAFDYILPVDLSDIFKRHKRFPAIVKTNETEKWNKAGLSRTVFFEDGTTAQESMLSVIQSKSFSYKIENFTSPLRRLAKRIEGEYVFTELENGQTKIVWTYVIIPKNVFAKAVIKIAVIKDLNMLLTNALEILKQDLESKEFKSSAVD